MIYERIKQLCDKNGISVSELERRVGVSRGSICKIDKHKPNSTTFNKIATELKVDSDYLLTGEESAISDDMVSEHIELISLYERLTEKQKISVINLMKVMVGEKGE